MTSIVDQTILSAHAFVDSIGVNAHVAFGWGGYDDLALVEADLQYLGVTKLRDGLTTNPALQPVLDGLATAGYKFDLGVSSSVPAGGSAALSQYLTLLNQFEASHPGSITAVEGLNEANAQAFSYNGSSSISAAAQFQKALYAAVHGDAHLAGIPVYDLTLASNVPGTYAQLGNMSGATDYVNAHVYVPTNISPAAGIAAGVAQVEATARGKPAVITETGYTTDGTTPYVGTDQTVQAKSILNTLLDAYKAGVSTTYIYELLDENQSSSSTGGSASNFGLFNAHNTPKIAATAIHNLTTILADDGTGGDQPTAALNYSLANMPGSGNSMVLGKSDGAYDLVLWAEPRLWNGSTDTEISNPTETVTVDLGAIHKSVKVYDPMSGTAPIAVYSNVEKIQVPITDHPVIIEIDAPASVSAPSMPADVSGTAADIVAQLSALNVSTTLKSITLTDTHTLPVASPATMAYIVSHYGSALAAIQGGYTFSITNTTATWSETKVYDSTGTNLFSTTDSIFQNGVITTKETVNADHSTDTIYYANGTATQQVIVQANGVTETKFYARDGSVTNDTVQNTDGSSSTTLYTNGVEMKKYVSNADGSHDTYTYGIIGQSYTTQIQHSDPTGKVTSVTEQHANGSLAYTMVVNPDGSKVTTLYDTTGNKTSMVTVAGSTTITDEYNTAGQLTEVVVQQAGVATTTTLYAGTHLSAVYVVNANGSKETKLYDASGNLSSDAAINANGSSSTTTYSEGVKTGVYVANADGSHDTYIYDIAGQAYSTDYQHTSPTGQVTAETRSHADGSLNYTMAIESSGAELVDLYDATGHKTTATATNPDGSSLTDLYNTSGSLVQSIAKDGSGDVTTTNYASGHTASIYVVDANGLKESKLFDSTGHLTSDYLQNPDGSSSTALYTGGVETNLYITNANGTHDDYFYNITGQAYVTDHQHTSANGTLLSETRTHANGSLDYTMTMNSDGSKVVNLYDSVGNKNQEVIYNSNGSRDVYKYEIAGSPGAVEHDAYNAAGQLLTIDVLNSNGTHNEIAVAAKQTLTGGAGNDVFSTQGGSTTVVYSGGNDQINNFHAGNAGNHDTIQIAQSLASDYSHLQIQQSGSDTLVHVATNDTIVLKNVAAGSVGGGDFHFV